MMPGFQLERLGYDWRSGELEPQFLVILMYRPTLRLRGSHSADCCLFFSESETTGAEGWRKREGEGESEQGVGISQSSEFLTGRLGRSF